MDVLSDQIILKLISGHDGSVAMNLAEIHDVVAVGTGSFAVISSIPGQ
jgi:hypothetical protein